MKLKNDSIVKSVTKNGFKGWRPKLATGQGLRPKHLSKSLEYYYEFMYVNMLYMFYCYLFYLGLNINLELIKFLDVDKKNQYFKPIMEIWHVKYNRNEILLQEGCTFPLTIYIFEQNNMTYVIFVLYYIIIHTRSILQCKYYILLV